MEILSGWGVFQEAGCCWKFDGIDAAVEFPGGVVCGDFAFFGEALAVGSKMDADALAVPGNAPVVSADPDLVMAYVTGIIEMGHVQVFFYCVVTHDADSFVGGYVKKHVPFSREEVSAGNPIIAFGTVNPVTVCSGSSVADTGQLPFSGEHSQQFHFFLWERVVIPDRFTGRIANHVQAALFYFLGKCRYFDGPVYDSHVFILFQYHRRIGRRIFRLTVVVFLTFHNLVGK